MTMLPMNSPLGGGGLFGRKRKMMGDPNTAAGIDAYRQQQGVKPEKQGTDWGAVGQHAAGSIGDAIAQYYGVAPAYAPQLRQRQIFDQQAQLQAERQRQQSLLQAQRGQQAMDLHRFKIDNPNDALTQSLRGAGIDPSGEEGRALYSQRAQTIARGPEPFVQADIPGVGRFYGNPSGIPDVVNRSKQPTAPGGLLPQRPQGKTDGELYNEARQAIANGAPRDAVRRQLEIWGVRDPATM